MMKKDKKLLLTSLTALCGCALLVGGTACGSKEKEESSTPAPTVEYTLTVAPETLNINLFEEVEVEAVAKQDGKVVEEAEIVWTSSAASVATVKDGIIESVSTGSATITATWEGQTATCSVEVKDDGSRPTLQVSESDIGISLLMTDEPYQLLPKVFYKDAQRDTTSASYTYAITDGESVATVDKNGTVTPVSAGTAKLTVSAAWKGYSGEGMTKEVAITVANHVETGITAEVTELKAFNGSIGSETYSNTTTFVGTVTLNGEPVTATELTWHSTNNDVVTVNNGVVTATAVGEAEVYYTYNDGTREYISDYVKVKVFPVQVSLTETLGEIVLIKDTAAVTTDYELAFEGFSAQACTITKVTTAEGEEVRASYDKTSKTFTLYNDKVSGTADEYVQGVIGLQNGGKQILTVYTAEKVEYEVKLNVVSREISTKDGLTAFFASYASETAAAEDTTLSTYGTYTTLSANITTDTMATTSARFAGRFDGRGHTVTYTGSAFGTKRGAFGIAIMGSATVENTAFIGLKTGTGNGGGLAYLLAGVVDNCYVEVALNGLKTNATTAAAQGGISWKLQGMVSNTIVNVTSAPEAESENRGTICSQNDEGIVNNCFSIGVSCETEGKYAVGYSSAADAESEPNLAFTADGLKALIGTALPESYNSYWTLTDTSLSFGGTQLLTFTAPSQNA